MKKHAKKSLLVPILALVSVIAIAACCYLAQSFSAFAEEEPVLEPTIALEDAAASASEEAELGQANPSGNSDQTSTDGAQTTPTGNRLMTRIHFSTGDIMTGSIVNTDDGSSLPFWPAEALAHEFTWDGDYNAIMSDTSEEDSIGIYVDSTGGGSTDMVAVNIPWGKSLGTTTVPHPFFSLNWVDDNSVDILIHIYPIYYICYDANGGSFSESGMWFYYRPQEEGLIWYDMPREDQLISPGENWKFIGWFTERFGGEQVIYQQPAQNLDNYLVLFAHWEWVDNPDKPINVYFETDNFFTTFNYRFIRYEKGSSVVVDEGKTRNISLFDLYDKKSIPDENKLTSNSVTKVDFVANLFNEPSLTLMWFDDLGIRWTLYLTADSGHHLNWAKLNDTKIDPYVTVTYVPNFSRVVLSIENDIPSFMSVSSDNGSLFKCRILDGKGGDEEFISDYVPIFVESGCVMYYYYGVDSPTIPRNNNLLYSENSDATDDNYYGLKFSIVVKPPESAPRTYVFSDYFFTLFDWFYLNSYINGVIIDDKNISNFGILYERQLYCGYHTITLKMSDHVADTSVTYKANGGMFTDGSDSMTLDATYGEELPLVGNPTLADNDFVGWFTEPEGGVQVDPKNFHWMPWQKWEGVTLYAHWAYNPQPVPPEPVPPTPPEPVNPDVPGGGGTAQTGDNSGIAFAIAGMIALCGACGFAAAARSRKNFSTWF